MYDSEVMCRKEVDTPWSIYRDFTVRVKIIGNVFGNWIFVLIAITHLFSRPCQRMCRRARATAPSTQVWIAVGARAHPTPKRVRRARASRRRAPTRVATRPSMRRPARRRPATMTRKVSSTSHCPRSWWTRATRLVATMCQWGLLAWATWNARTRGTEDGNVKLLSISIDNLCCQFKISKMLFLKFG